MSFLAINVTVNVFVALLVVVVYFSIDKKMLHTGCPTAHGLLTFLSIFDETLHSKLFQAKYVFC